MDWAATVDAYCERLDAGFWAEPLNAVTNLSFLIAAVVMAWRLRGSGLVKAWLLVAILTAIGVGSFLFHTFATRWAGLADTLPIALFLFAHTYATARDILGLARWKAVAVMFGFIPFAALLYPVLDLLPLFGSSTAYVPVLLWIGLFAFLTPRRASRDFGVAFVILALSLIARSLDEPLCATIPFGTHFLWHILNGVLLGWLIETYRRGAIQAPLAKAARGG